MRASVAALGRLSGVCVLAKIWPPVAKWAAAWCSNWAMEAVSRPVVGSSSSQMGAWLAMIRASARPANGASG